MNAQSLINQLCVFETTDECVHSLFQKVMDNQGITTVGFLNQHGLNLALKNPKIHFLFSELDVVLRDGIGVKLAMKWFKNPAYGANLNGTDLIPKIVNHPATQNARFYVFGTESPWLELGSEKLLNGQKGLIADGFKDLDYYINLLKTFDHPDDFKVIVLAMGMPKQEELALRIRQEISGQGMVICGGAIVDFSAERFPRAPMWMQKMALEWLFRLLKEPKRLFRRYVIGIPLFFMHLLKG